MSAHETYENSFTTCVDDLAALFESHDLTEEVVILQEFLPLKPDEPVKMICSRDHFGTIQKLLTDEKDVRFHYDGRQWSYGSVGSATIVPMRIWDWDGVVFCRGPRRGVQQV